jgi:DNA-directed RNA polymerase specialized sigma24 family protein
LQQALRLASLDQPQLLEESESLTLQDQLVDPASADRYAGAVRSERRRLLWRALRRLERSQRRLLLGRVLQQRAWGELGAQFGLSAKVTQRRFAQLLELLRQQLGPDLAADLA